MLNKNFLVNFIWNKLSLDYSKEDLVDLLKLKPKTIDIIATVYETNEKWGQKLNFLEMIDLYKEGLTNPEISLLKGISRQAVFNSIAGNYMGDIDKLKEVNKENRKKIKNIILYDITVGESLRTDIETARIKSGYTKASFYINYNNAKNWKLIQEILEGN